MRSTQEKVLNYLKTIPQGITFVHGKAGCGKTFLINRLVNMVYGCQVLTPTNLAASLYKGARTLHSYFHSAFDDLDEGYMNPENLAGRNLTAIGSILKSIRMIIFDEISMVRADYFEMMNQICQKAMCNPRPFGGIPVVIVGDLFQLPPIVSDNAVWEYLKREYGGIYFFNSHVIQREIQHIKYFELTKSYRQANDPEFVEILDAFRQPMSANRKVAVMNLINSRVTNDLPGDAIYVASSNEEVRQVNTKKLGELPGRTITIDAEYTILKKDRTGHVVLKQSQLPSDEDIFEIVVPSAYDSQLTFKKGARVMLCKNSRAAGYINGDFGVVENFNGDYFTIRLEKDNRTVLCPNPNDKYKSSQKNEYRYEMEYDPVKHRLVRKSTFLQKTTQFPLKLAYAFTIHKAQGQTYEKVILDLNSHIFAPGQLYVALSRAKSLQGLFLTKPVTYSDIISDNSIFEFLDKVGTDNSTETTVDAFSSPAVIPDEACDDFASFVRGHETSLPSKEYILHTLDSYKMLMHIQEYEKAAWELQKVVNLIGSTYQTDRCLQLPDCLKEKPVTKDMCQSALRTISDLYMGVYSSPHKQFQSDNRTVTLNLSRE